MLKFIGLFFLLFINLHGYGQILNPEASADFKEYLKDIELDSAGLFAMSEAIFGEASKFDDVVLNMYKITRESLLLESKEIFTEDEFKILNSYSIVISENEKMLYNPVKINKRKKQIILSNTLLMFSSNVLWFLDCENSELDRLELDKLYLGALRYLHPTSDGEEILKFNASIKDSENYKLIKAGINSSQFIIYLFCELHEIYHACYDPDHKSTHTEFKADLFAIKKIVELLDLKNIAIGPIALNEESNILLNDKDFSFMVYILRISQVFDVLIANYSNHPEHFGKSISHLTERKINLIKYGLEQVTSLDVNQKNNYLQLIEGLSSFKNYIKDDSTIEYYKSLVKDDVNDIDFNDNFLVHKNITHKLSNGEFESAKEICKIGIGSKIGIDLKEALLLLIGHLELREFQVPKAIEYINQARAIGRNYPDDYYSSLLIYCNKANTIDLFDVVNEIDSLIGDSLEYFNSIPTSNINIKGQFFDSQINIKINDSQGNLKYIIDGSSNKKNLGLRLEKKLNSPYSILYFQEHDTIYGNIIYLLNEDQFILMKNDKSHISNLEDIDDLISQSEMEILLMEHIISVMKKYPFLIESEISDCMISKGNLPIYLNEYIASFVLNSYLNDEIKNDKCGPLLQFFFSNFNKCKIDN